MKVQKLRLHAFRNVTDASFSPDPHLNFLVGQNGQGKTSFLEAIGYLATLRSFRGAHSDEVIQWGHDSSEVSCLFAHDEPGYETELKVSFIKQGERTSKMAFINGKAFRSSTQYLSQRFGHFEMGFHAVVFNPSDHDLVRGEPSGRRNYLDRVIAAEDVRYLETLQKYKRVVEQRNAHFKSSESPSRDVLMGFTEPLVELGSEIWLQRIKWIQRLGERLDDVAHEIAPKQANLRVFYLSNWAPQIVGLSCHFDNLDSVHFAGQGPLPSLEIIEQTFWNRLSSLQEAELRARSSLVGPHRDDWGFSLGEQALKSFGSQGEVRTALLALKLCEIELFRKVTGHRPLLLLDDFSSELDRDRRAFLLRFLTESDLQVFVTTTEDAVFAGKRYWVSNGNLNESPLEVIQGSPEQSV